MGPPWTCDGTASDYLTPLRARVRGEVAYHLVKQTERIVKEHAPEEEIIQTIQAEPLPPPAHPTDPITRLVDKQVRAIDAQTTIKYGIVKQVHRIEALTALEERGNGVLLPNGWKEFDTLLELCDSLRRCEVDEQIIKNKGCTML